MKDKTRYICIPPRGEDEGQIIFNTPSEERFEEVHQMLKKYFDIAETTEEELWAASYNFKQNMYDVSPLKETEKRNLRAVLDDDPANVWLIYCIGTQEDCVGLAEEWRHTLTRIYGVDRLAIIDEEER